VAARERQSGRATTQQLLEKAKPVYNDAAEKEIINDCSHIKDPTPKGSDHEESLRDCCFNGCRKFFSGIRFLCIGTRMNWIFPG
jgi:hypothetical protein